MLFACGSPLRSLNFSPAHCHSKHLANNVVFVFPGPISVVPPPQPAQAQPQAQMSPNLAMLFPGRSPQQYVPDIKLEPAILDMDSRSNPCPTGTFNYPSPHSTCSIVDSIPPIQIGQNTNHLYIPESSNVSMTSCSPTHFNGGSMTPINQTNNNNNNNNMVMNNNMNYLEMNNVGVMKMNAMSSTAPRNQHQVYQQPPLPQYQAEQNAYLPAQSQYPIQAEQQQFTQPTHLQQEAEDHLPSFSDLILNGTPMDLGSIDLIDETLSSLGLAGDGAVGFAGTPQMNNNFANY